MLLLALKCYKTLATPSTEYTKHKQILLSTTYLINKKEEAKELKMKMENNHMIEGTGDDSYARNSQIQAYSIAKVFPMVRDALEELYSTTMPKTLIAAELGCASGPNTLMIIPELIDVTYKSYRDNNKGWQRKNDEDIIPEIKVFLNDLPSNDFNTISRSLPNFDKVLKEERDGDVGPYFISTTPGSFHKKVFPSNFLHFVHTSNSAHWLSQVPKGLFSKTGEPLNKGNIYISDTSSPQVLAAYREQFEEDFTMFLEHRGKEIVTGGRLIINIMASTNTHAPQDLFMKRALNMALQTMVEEGLIDEKKLDEFDMPFYPPTTKEVKRLIKGEGSFRLHKHEIFNVEWDLPTEAMRKTDGEYYTISSSHNHAKLDKWVRAKFAAGAVRAATECIMATQFGKHVMEDLYSQVTELLVKRLAVAKLETFHHAISLIKV